MRGAVKKDDKIETHRSPCIEKPRFDFAAPFFNYGIPTIAFEKGKLFRTDRGLEVNVISYIRYEYFQIGTVRAYVHVYVYVYV